MADDTAGKVLMGIGVGGLIILGIAVGYSAISAQAQTTSGNDVSNLNVCDTSIKNGDYAYVQDQAETGLTGYFEIIDASDMINDATIGHRCGETVSYFIQTHPFANDTFYKYVGSSPP
mgnify:CR=1 FL=1